VSATVVVSSRFHSESGPGANSCELNRRSARTGLKRGECAAHGDSRCAFWRPRERLRRAGALKLLGAGSELQSSRCDRLDL
jgi:hypothetical protein